MGAAMLEPAPRMPLGHDFARTSSGLDDVHRKRRLRLLLRAALPSWVSTVGGPANRSRRTRPVATSSCRADVDVRSWLSVFFCKPVICSASETRVKSASQNVWLPTRPSPIVCFTEKGLLSCRNVGAADWRAFEPDLRGPAPVGRPDSISRWLTTPSPSFVPPRWMR